MSQHVLADGTVSSLDQKIAQEATHALLDQPAHMLRVMAHHDALMAALPGWRKASMFDLTKHARDPFAWFLFHHPERGWWMSLRVASACLSHPFDGSYIQTALIQPGAMVVGQDEDEFLDAAHDLAERAGGAVSGREPLDTIHVRWVLGHFPDSEKARAYVMLLGLTQTV